MELSESSWFTESTQDCFQGDYLVDGRWYIVYGANIWDKDACFTPTKWCGHNFNLIELTNCEFVIIYKAFVKIKYVRLNLMNLLNRTSINMQ